MGQKMEIKNSSDVDKGLVAMFLRMSPEERLKRIPKTLRKSKD